jgi:succinate-acetate transporter protein
MPACNVPENLRTRTRRGPVPARAAAIAQPAPAGNAGFATGTFVSSFIAASRRRRHEGSETRRWRWQ